MTNEEIENIMSNLDLDHFILDRESVLKNNSIEKTAEDVVKELLPSIQLRMMNLSETDKSQFIKMEIEKDNRELEEDYYFKYVSDKFNETIEERCLSQDLWSTEEEYKEKWKKQFPEKAKKIEEMVSTLSTEIESNNLQMEEERKKKVVDINSKKDRERRLVDLAWTKKGLIEGFDQFLIDQMDYDSEDVYEHLTLKVIKQVEQAVAKEARLVVNPYIQKEVVESYGNFNHSRPEASASKK